MDGRPAHNPIAAVRSIHQRVSFVMRAIGLLDSDWVLMSEVAHSFGRDLSRLSGAYSGQR